MASLARSTTRAKLARNRLAGPPGAPQLVPRQSVVFGGKATLPLWPQKFIHPLANHCPVVVPAGYAAFVLLMKPLDGGSSRRISDRDRWFGDRLRRPVTFFITP